MGPKGTRRKNDNPQFISRIGIYENHRYSNMQTPGPELERMLLEYEEENNQYERWPKLAQLGQIWGIDLVTDSNNIREFNNLLLKNLVRPVGFEPTAFCSGGKRSIQAELRAHERLL
jgi:hypothetical protein